MARLRAQASAALSNDDALELALVPAMDHGGRPMWAVLEAFGARLDTVPDAVQRAVFQVEDLDQLHRWHRAVVRARHEADAQRAVLEG